MGRVYPSNLRPGIALRCGWAGVVLAGYAIGSAYLQWSFFFDVLADCLTGVLLTVSQMSLLGQKTRSLGERLGCCWHNMPGCWWR